MLEAFTAPGRFFKGNLHCHSTRSDGARPPAEVCTLYREAGYDFIALTDHFLERYGFPIVDTRDFRTNAFTTIVGAEVHAPAIGQGEPWHLLAVGLPLAFERTTVGETGPDLAQRCIDAGAFLALAHPAWYGLTTADAATIAKAHAVEIYNHASEVECARGDGAYLVDQLLSAGRQIDLIATDDAHLHRNDCFGGFVQVRAEANEPEALVAALKAGHYYASQGPAIHHVALAADAVEVECSAAAAVMLLGRAPVAVQVVAPGTTRARLPLARAAASGHARIVVIDAQGRKAWTNPMYFDRSSM